MRRSVEDDISICVGTVRRPYCIQRFISSVRANFSRIPIIVGDQDKPNPYLHAFYEDAGVKVVYVAVDAGVGVARHAAIAEVKTEYILFATTISFFRPKHDLMRLFGSSSMIERSTLSADRSEILSVE